MLRFWKNRRLCLSVLSNLQLRRSPLPDQEHRAPAALPGHGSPGIPRATTLLARQRSPRVRTDFVPSSASFPLPCSAEGPFLFAGHNPSPAFVISLWNLTWGLRAMYQGGICFWARGKKDNWWTPYRNPVKVVGFSSKGDSCTKNTPNASAGSSLQKPRIWLHGSSFISFEEIMAIQIYLFYFSWNPSLFWTLWSD